MDDESAGESPGERVDAARAALAAEEAALEAKLASIADRLAAALQEVAKIRVEQAEAVREAEPRLGATRVKNAARISRARVYQLVPEKGTSPQGPQRTAAE